MKNKKNMKKQKVEVEWTREAIGREILAWRDHDPAYTLTLVPLALNQGLITEEEAELAKQDLDEYYKGIAADAERVKSNKAAVMLKIFQDLGFTATKILWRIVELFPTCFVEAPHQQLIRIPHERLIKQLKIRSYDYYAYIKQLEQHGFLEHIKGAIWFIDFSSMKDYEPKATTCSDDTQMKAELEIENA